MNKVTGLLYSGLYIVLAGGFLALGVLARREEVPAFARDPPVLLPLRRMAVFLCRKLYEFREKLRRGGRELPIPGEEGLRSDLAVLYPVQKARRREVLYRIERAEKLLLLIIAGITLAGALHFASLRSGLLREDGTIERAPAGGEDRRVSLLARPVQEEEGAGAKALLPSGAASSGKEESGETSPGEVSSGRTSSGQDSFLKEEKGKQEEKKDYGTYSFTVHARQLTRQEAQARAQEILDQYPGCLLGENRDPAEIRYPLSMPAAEDAEPFVLGWESSRYSVLDTDGSIFNSDYGEEQAEQVDLTVFLTYADYRFEKKMHFTVRAPVRDEETRTREKITEALKAAEKESSVDQTFVVPSGAAGLALSWEEKVEDLSPGFLLLALLVCVSAWYIMGRRLHERTIERSRQLAIDYPQLISRIVLYLGAGMSVRNIFYKCGADYLAQTNDPADRKRGRRENGRYLGEEILLVCNELDSGVAEAEAYMHFGRRCRSRQYTKLCSLLVQNLRRGNDTLLDVLQEEAQNAFEERKNLARELGEEAGTKLLFPMMIMLGITMLIIIVPAYFSFAM